MIAIEPGFGRLVNGIETGDLDVSLVAPVIDLRQALVLPAFPCVNEFEAPDGREESAARSLEVVPAIISFHSHSSEETGKALVRRSMANVPSENNALDHAAVVPFSVVPSKIQPYRDELHELIHSAVTSA